MLYRLVFRMGGARSAGAAGVFAAAFRGGDRCRGAHGRGGFAVIGPADQEQGGADQGESCAKHFQKVALGIGQF